MKILQEGQILILPDGKVIIQNFKIQGNPELLRDEVFRRIKKAYDKISPKRIILASPNDMVK